jgi:chemotaxis signal transduction protein
MIRASVDAYLLFRAGDQICAISARHVDETMRPMKIVPLDKVPAFVLGLSVIRGTPYPIIDLRKILGRDTHELPKRLIALHVDRARRVGVLVDEVLGLYPAHLLAFEPLPPIMEAAHAEVTESLATLDGELLRVLGKGRLVPEAVWQNVALLQTKANGNSSASTGGSS